MLFNWVRLLRVESDPMTKVICHGLDMIRHFIYVMQWFLYYFSVMSHNPVLVGGLEHFLFFHILADQYSSEGLKPPTRVVFLFIPITN